MGSVEAEPFCFELADGCFGIGMVIQGNPFLAALGRAVEGAWPPVETHRVGFQRPDGGVPRGLGVALERRRLAQRHLCSGDLGGQTIGFCLGFSKIALDDGELTLEGGKSRIGGRDLVLDSLDAAQQFGQVGLGVRQVLAGLLEFLGDVAGVVGRRDRRWHGHGRTQRCCQQQRTTWTAGSQADRRLHQVGCAHSLPDPAHG